MADPLLYDLMHGITVPNRQRENSSVKKSVERDPFDLALDQAIKEHVDSIIAQEDTNNNKLLTPGEKRAKLEQEIRGAADFSEFGQNLTSAVIILRNEGQKYLEKEQFGTLQDNLNNLSQQLDILDPGSINDETLHAALRISESSSRYILKIAIDKYTEGLIFESLSLFVFLTTMNPGEPDYWYRLGLVAQKCEKYELALHAFTTTAELAPEFIGAHIYAAYNHLKKNSQEAATAELAQAKIILNTTQVEENWQKHVIDIENLLAVSNLT